MHGKTEYGKDRVQLDVEASFRSGGAVRSLIVIPGVNKTDAALARLKNGSLFLGRLHVSGLRLRVRDGVGSVVHDSHSPSRPLTQVGISSMDGVAVVS